MGLYTKFDDDNINVTEMQVNMDELLEAFFFDEHYSDSDEEKRALLEDVDVLMEAKRISNKTIVKLNKNDDLTRRTGIAALQLAKDNNDPLWRGLVGVRIKERKFLAAIRKKYSRNAAILARKIQHDFISNQGAKKIPDHKLKPKEMAKSRY